MTIQGINPYSMPTVVPGNPRMPGPDTTQGPGLGAPQEAPTPSSASVGRAAEMVPAEAPLGTDPMLWSVLTAEERSFFARARSMGQITYGPGSRASDAGIPRGGRLDVKV